MATVRLKTVANSWWGIQGGHEVEVTWMYLARCPEWEARLPADVRARLANPSDPELRGFPHFPTTDLFLTATQARGAARRGRAVGSAGEKGGRRRACGFVRASWSFGEERGALCGC